jgi:hypothetical protein
MRHDDSVLSDAELDDVRSGECHSACRLIRE